MGCLLIISTNGNQIRSLLTSGEQSASTTSICDTFQISSISSTGSEFNSLLIRFQSESSIPEVDSAIYAFFKDGDGNVISDSDSDGERLQFDVLAFEGNDDINNMDIGVSLDSYDELTQQQTIDWKSITFVCSV